MTRCRMEHLYVYTYTCGYRYYIDISKPILRVVLSLINEQHWTIHGACCNPSTGLYVLTGILFLSIVLYCTLLKRHFVLLGLGCSRYQGRLLALRVW